ncbi:hypothetical protein EMIHUDRAFT_257032 [Emiliania huxleyi CCMP1516]|uniref:Uncharacterized protein n=2 Tax=Emiliania huxleyi TaxID=2903 RepID=A0A0D3IND6_EMIH1|nr:hypothetical protein EMIHUDRAFT_257032 [Emiliania huxleyi CCMP1516]EOD12771.1 hypothetical protein EMIHUDRAFT_257032 [Emiliania huxleyi CCMP1516]|eukprot:XP_005765200.1 hypothetical protein EMIHUDRAFT_257032 [Emiliania huxleyi CCMP1516]
MVCSSLGAGHRRSAHACSEPESGSGCRAKELHRRGWRSRGWRSRGWQSRDWRSSSEGRAISSTS